MTASTEPFEIPKNARQAPRRKLFQQLVLDRLAEGASLEFFHLGRHGGPPFVELVEGDGRRVPLDFRQHLRGFHNMCLRGEIVCVKTYPTYTVWELPKPEKQWSPFT